MTIETMKIHLEALIQLNKIDREARTQNGENHEYYIYCTGKINAYKRCLSMLKEVENDKK